MLSIHARDLHTIFEASRINTFRNIKCVKYATPTFLCKIVSIDIRELRTKFEASRLNTFRYISCLKYATPTFEYAHLCLCGMNCHHRP